MAVLAVLSFLSIWGIIFDLKLAGQHFFSTIFVPLLLSVYFIPFLIVFNALLVVDERVRRLRRSRAVNNFSFSVCLNLFLCFGFSLRYFDRWCSFVALHRPRSTEGVIATIFEVSRNIRDQSEWRLQYCSDGWSPITLMSALSEFSVQVYNYDRHAFDWYGESGPIYHDRERCANFIKYSICGDRNCVKEVVLELDIMDSDCADQMVERFSLMVEAILKKVSSEKIAIEADNFCIQLDGARFTVSTFYSGNANEFAHREVTIQRATDRFDL